VVSHVYSVYIHYPADDMRIFCSLFGYEQLPLIFCFLKYSF